MQACKLDLALDLAGCWQVRLCKALLPDDSGPLASLESRYPEMVSLRSGLRLGVLGGIKGLPNLCTSKLAVPLVPLSRLLKQLCTSMKKV